MSITVSVRRCCAQSPQTVSCLQQYCFESAKAHVFPPRFLLPYLGRSRGVKAVHIFRSSFSTTSLYCKSGGKQHNKSNVDKAVQKTAGSDDPFDFSDYEDAISKAHGHLKSEVSKIKAGGRDVEGIEGIRVNLGKGNQKGKGNVVRVGDLASVVARGRNVVIMVAEKDVRGSLRTYYVGY